MECRNTCCKDFTDVFHVDLHGNVRRNPKLSGTTHNVFGIQVGVGVTVAVRRNSSGTHQLHYSRVPENWRKEEKLAWLAKCEGIGGVDWRTLPSHAWIGLKNADEFEAFLPLGTTSLKASKTKELPGVFKSYSLGVATNRDEWVFDFSREGLSQMMGKFIRNYNYEVFRLAQESPPPQDLDSFVNNEPDFLKWTDRRKNHLKLAQTLKFEGECIRAAFYRPFTRKFLYFDPLLNHRQYMQRRFFPVADAENKILCCTNHTQIPFSCQMTNCLPDQAPGGRGGQSLPFYVYDEDGTNRRENITDWALEHFRKHYKDKKIAKWDIFYYVYGLLHHPEYRAKYAENLKRELPRIPLASDFWGIAKAGKELARLHIEYETLEPWPLEFIETSNVTAALRRHPEIRQDGGGTVAPMSPSAAPSLRGNGKSPVGPPALQRANLKVGGTIPLSYRVEDKMRLAKDHRSLKVNDSLTLGGIPPETFEYRLGNRSALEWVIDQYQVTEDKHSGIRSDPNRSDAPEYIVRLVGQVIYVSVETARIVNS